MDKVKDGCLQPTQSISDQNKTNMETNQVAFNAASFAEVLVEVGKQLLRAQEDVNFQESQKRFTERELKRTTDDLKRSAEYSRKCDSFISSLQESADKDKSEIIALRAEFAKLKAKVSKAAKVAKSRHKPKGSTTKAQITLETKANYSERGKEREEGEDGEFEPKDQR